MPRQPRLTPADCESAPPEQPTIAFRAADVARAEQAVKPRKRPRRRFELPRVKPRP